MPGLVLREQEERDAAAVTRIRRESDDALVITEAAWIHRLRHSIPRERMLRLAAELEGEVVGIGQAGLNISTTIPGAAWATVNVSSAYRGRGIGAALHDRLVAHLREIEAKRLTSFFRWSAEGERWAAARGWERLLTGPLIALDPRADVPDPELPPGFECLSIAAFDRPEAIFELMRIVLLDEPNPMPIDDLRYEDWLHEWEDPDVDRDATTVVVHDQAPVAFAYVNVAGDRAAHGGTGTHPDYRGRGLATAAKRRLLRTVAAKGVTRITTSNAEENAPMRAINRRLGFQPIGEHVIFGRDV